MSGSKTRGKLVRRVLLWATLLGLGGLIVLSMVGAFVGADRAKGLFNSWAMAGYWVFLTLLLVVGVGVFAALRRRWGLLAMHVGAVLVLVGSMAGSERGHGVLDRWREEAKVPVGVMRVGEGFREDRLVDMRTGEAVGQLPFEVGLRDFWMEYYATEPVLVVEFPSGMQVSVVVREGSSLPMREPFPEVTVVRVFRSFRMVLSPERRVMDEPTGPPNPALELKLVYPDGTEKRRYVFEQHAGHGEDEGGLAFRYDSGRGRMVRDYFSDLVVLSKEESDGAGEVSDRLGEVLVEKAIEVNDPLHYGGYHFYQSSYGKLRMEKGETGVEEAIWYTELLVVSDTGWSVVFAGYVVLLAGAFWHCWVGPAWRRLAGRTARRKVSEASAAVVQAAREASGDSVQSDGAGGAGGVSGEVGNFGEST